MLPLSRARERGLGGEGLHRAHGPGGEGLHRAHGRGVRGFTVHMGWGGEWDAYTRYCSTAFGFNSNPSPGLSWYGDHIPFFGSGNSV